MFPLRPLVALASCSPPAPQGCCFRCQLFVGRLLLVVIRARPGSTIFTPSSDHVSQKPGARELRHLQGCAPAIGGGGCYHLFSRTSMSASRSGLTLLHPLGLGGLQIVHSSLYFPSCRRRPGWSRHCKGFHHPRWFESTPHLSLCHRERRDGPPWWLPSPHHVPAWARGA